MVNYRILSFLIFCAIMEKSEHNECNLKYFNSSELMDIEQVKLTMEKVKQSIHQKSQNDPEIGFLLKRL
jgi:hypothetical protein